MNVGAFFAIEGQDGTGKTDQTKLLVGHLKQKGYKAESMEFPQYGRKSAGPLEEYLSGKYGKDLDSYAASVLYAVDRFDASKTILKLLEGGYVVVANRYVASNAGHQGGKIRNSDKRKDFFHWLWNFEYTVLAIPKPDVNFLLKMPLEISLELMAQRREKDAARRTDIHEADREHLRNTVKSYEHLLEVYGGEFVPIDCVGSTGSVLPRDVIHEKIWTHVNMLLK